MLIFLHKYLLIKLMNNNILKQKLMLNKNTINICINNNTNYYLYKYFDIKVLNNYINLNFFINFFIKIFSTDIKPYFILSKTFVTTQSYLNEYIHFNNRSSDIDLLLILDGKINNKTLANLKKLNLPIFILSNGVNIKYFDYYLTTTVKNYTVEYFIIEFFSYIYLSLKQKKSIDLKQKYIDLNNINILKKNV